MQRMNVECPQNVLLISCEENDCRQILFWQGAQNFKPIHPGHMDVEEYNIRRLFQYPLCSRNAISAFANDLNILELTQPVNDTAARQRFVIHD